MLKAQLEELISLALQKTGESVDVAKIALVFELSDRGDFACAIAPKITRHGASANVLAQAIAKQLDSELLEKVDVAENGFINLFVSPKALSMTIHNLLNSKLEEAPNSAYLSCNISEKDVEQAFYTWRRLSAALRQLTEPRLNLLDSCLIPPLIEHAEWVKIESQYLADMHVLLPAFDDNLAGHKIALANRKLALHLNEFFSVRNLGAKDVLNVKSYLINLNGSINQSPVLDELVLAGPEIRNARIGLISAAKRVLGSCLGILNLAVPDRL